MGEATEAWSSWPAPAKLNLFLRVLGRRSDGYHELQTVFQLLDWGDTVRLRSRQDADLLLLKGAPDVPAELDLTLRAARLLQAETGCNVGADILLDKRIPSGAGLGGGSSDAASVLVGLNQLWRLGLDVDRLADLGLQLGADVPVFVRGHSAWAEGLGERLTPLNLPKRYFLVLMPEVHIATAELFAAQELTRNGERATIAGFVSSELTDNAFTSIVRTRAPQVDEALKHLSQYGAARMSGTGSACFVAFDCRQAAEGAAASCSDRFSVQVAEGVYRSALLDAVDNYRAQMTASG